MRKIISLSMGVALAVTVFAAAPAAAESATVSSGGDCFIPGFGSGGELVAPMNQDGKIIYGKIKKLVQVDNHWMITCKGDIPNNYRPNNKPQAHQAAGWGCYVPTPSGEYVATWDSFVKITKDGKASMKCKAPAVYPAEG